jgi:hypothetical protein
MEPQVNLKKQQYIKWINELYGQVKKWVGTKNLVTKEKEVELNEELLGKYKVPGLLIEEKKGKKIAELKPAGALIIGAMGRVDVIGELDRANLVYMEPSGPGIVITEKVTGEEPQRPSRPLFRGVDRSGWYWIESARLGRAKPVTQELFIDLLTEVSDYES